MPSLATIYRRYQGDPHPALNRLRRGDGGRFVPGVGPVPNHVMLLGEAPGEDEVVAGRPFVGRAGKILNEWMTEARLDRRELFVTNSVKYRPVKSKGQNRRPWTSELEVSRRYLDHEIAIVRPQWIVALGGTALKMLWLDGLASPPKVTEAHGGVFFHTKNFTRIFVMYHPAAVLHDESKAADAIADARELGRIIRVDGSWPGD